MKAIDKNIDELALVVLLLIVSGSMLVITFEYPYEAALFPRFAATITFVGALLVLLEPYLPPSIQSVVGESTQMFSNEGVEEQMETVDDTTEDNADGTVARDDKLGLLNDSAKTTYAIALYAVGSFLFGMLWVTPVFVLAYIMLFGGSRVMAVVLSIVSFGIAFVFMDLLNVAIDSGLIV